MKQLLTTAFLFCILTASSQDNPFEKYGYTPTIATLSKGKYVEFFDRDTVVQIGRVIYNTKTKSIIGFVEYDTMRSEATLEPDLVSRWVSPDPLRHWAPGWSPYRFGFDNPVNYTDPTGLWEDHWQVDDDGKATLLDTKGDDIYVNDQLLSDFDFTGKESALASIGTYYYDNNFSTNKYHLSNNSVSVFNFEDGKFKSAFNSPNKPKRSAVLSVHPAKISEDGKNHLNLYTDEGYVSTKLNNKFNLINIISHEKTHFIQGVGSNPVNELEAYYVQTLHWSWSKTTSGHKKFVRSNVQDYLNDFRYNGTSDPTIRVEDKQYYLNMYNHYKSLFK